MVVVHLGLGGLETVWPRRIRRILLQKLVSQNIQISDLEVVIELQQRSENSAAITTSTAAYNVTFTQAFYATPTIGITPYDMAHNEDFTITNRTRTGFTIEFRHGGAAISRTFTYTAVGYGGVI